MVAGVERQARLRVDGWVQIQGGYSGNYDNKAAKVLQIDKKRNAVRLELRNAANEPISLWFENRYITAIKEAEARRILDAEAASKLESDLEDAVVNISPAINEIAPESITGDDAETAQTDSQPAPDNSSALTVQARAVEAEIVPSLSELESQIEQGQRAIRAGERQVWSAIAQIRQFDLWKEHVTAEGKPAYKSFEDYCQRFWGWKKSNAHEVAGAGEVLLQLQESGTPEHCIPTSIAAYRPLRNLAPEQRLEVIDHALETAGKLTAETISAAVLEMRPDTTNSKFDFVEFSEPKPCLHYFNGEQHPAKAIAHNAAGQVKLLWGENFEHESVTPARYVEFLPVAKMAFTPEEIEQGLREGWIVEMPTEGGADVTTGRAGAEGGAGSAEHPQSQPAGADAGADSRAVGAGEGENSQSALPPLQAAASDSQLASHNPRDLERERLKHQLETIAQQKSDEIYNALCTLGYSPDSKLVEVAEELRSVIYHVFKLHLIG